MKNKLLGFTYVIRKSLFILIVLCWGGLAYADISVGVVFNDDGEFCAKILVIAEGTAGPFTIDILDSAGDRVVLSSGVNPIENHSGTIEIAVPDGAYVVLVTDAFGCVEEYEVSVSQECNLQIFVEDIGHVDVCNPLPNGSCNSGYIHLKNSTSSGQVIYRWSAVIDGVPFSRSGSYINNLRPE